MEAFGKVSLYGAFVFSLLTMITILVGVRKNDLRFIEAGRRGILAMTFFIVMASVSLVYLFLTDNFQVEYVASYSNRSLPSFYKVAAFWAGQKGSLLFWALMLGLFSSVVAFRERVSERTRGMPYVFLVLASTSAFFLFLLSMVTNPFELLGFLPPDGRGLNPMLQNPGMVFHPPALFLGYVGFTVPFAYGVAALITGELDAAWLRKTRRWTIISWIFLSIGIILGGQWAYVELGWGGYWAWDPVENASLIPWLVATAFLHTSIIQERRNMMKMWNVVLIFLTFVLCLFGTYIVRSGVLQSVHDFGATGLGGYFLIFMGLVLFAGVYLIGESYGELRAVNAVESYLSRESTFLFNNIILLAIAFSTLLGTVFPLISEAVTGNKVTVGQPFFNLVNTPLFLMLLLLTGLCPLIGWRKASVDNLRKNFLVPFLITLAGAVSLFVVGVRDFYPLVSYSLSLFVSVTILMEFYRGGVARRKMTGENFFRAFLASVWKLRRRYGGYIVHFGVVLMIIGITGSSAYKLEKQQTLNRGEKIAVGDYVLRYDGLDSYSTPNKLVYSASLTVFKNGEEVGKINPERRYYTGWEQPTTEVSIRSSLAEDLYVTMPWIGRDGRITLKVAVNPLLSWIWIGGTILVLGAVFAILPERRRGVA